MLVGDLIKLNVNYEEIVPEEVGYGDFEFNVDDILASLNNLNRNIFFEFLILNCLYTSS